MASNRVGTLTNKEPLKFTGRIFAEGPIYWRKLCQRLCYPFGIGTSTNPSAALTLYPVGFPKIPTSLRTTKMRLLEECHIRHWDKNRWKSIYKGPVRWEGNLTLAYFPLRLIRRRFPIMSIVQPGEPILILLLPHRPSFQKGIGQDL